MSTKPAKTEKTSNPAEADLKREWGDDLSLNLEGWYNAEEAKKNKAILIGVLEDTFTWYDPESEESKDESMPVTEDGKRHNAKAFLVRLREDFPCAIYNEKPLAMVVGQVIGIRSKANLKPIATKVKVGDIMRLEALEKIDLGKGRTTWKFRIHAKADTDF